MKALDWSQCPAVESVPGRVGGAWVFRGTRLPVGTVIENLKDLSIEEVIEQFDVTREQISAVLGFIVQSLKRQSSARDHRTKGRNAEVEGCLRSDVVPVYDAMKANPKRGIAPNKVFSKIRSRAAKQSEQDRSVSHQGRQ
jgi:uncharacterized protein (DUF433 family)